MNLLDLFDSIETTTSDTSKDIEFVCTIPDSTAFLEEWIDSICGAMSVQCIYDQLSVFCKLQWSDDERSKVSRVYNRRIEALTAAAHEQPPGRATPPATPTGTAPRISRWEQYRRAKQESKAKRLQDASGGWWAND